MTTKKKPNPALRRLHALGNRFLTESERRERRGERNRGTMADLKAETQSDRNRLMEARRFARLYTKAELDWLCGLGQGRRKGRPLTSVDVRLLIRVSNSRRRKALARRCSVQEWTVRRLETEVKQIAEPRGYGGRRQTPPRSVEEALLVTERMAASWNRWIEVLRPDKAKICKRQITVNHLPKSMQTKLKKATDELENLRAEISRQLDSKHEYARAKAGPISPQVSMTAR